MPRTVSKTRLDLALAMMLSLTAATAATADTVEVQMLNYDRNDPTRVMVYEPEIVRIAPGDTVRFVSTDELHNAASVDGMIPDGATPFVTPISETFEVTFDVEGTYGYLCQPHAMVGMAGLILVGDHTVNLEAAKAVQHDGLLQDKFDQLFAKIE